MASPSLFLGTAPKGPVFDKAFRMHFGSSVHDTVAFLGFADNTKPGGIFCIGTGFLFGYVEYGYLVTAGHVAKKLGNDAFVIRINRRSGGSNIIDADRAEWIFHPDYPAVDIAIHPFNATPGRGFDCAYIPQATALTEAERKAQGIDVGDVCYTVGLFRGLSGTNRNLPVVHTGNIAQMMGDERIPVPNQETGEALQAEVILIESHGIKGISGAPVFVRAPCALELTPEQTLLAVNSRRRLLGVFSGAWFLPASAELKGTYNTRDGDTVPVGLGVVEPIHKLLEFLESPAVKGPRDEALKGGIKGVMKAAAD